MAGKLIDQRERLPVVDPIKTEQPDAGINRPDRRDLGIGRQRIGMTHVRFLPIFQVQATISATARCRCIMAGNEMSCGPSVEATICPVSPLGRKSLGTEV